MPMLLRNTSVSFLQSLGTYAQIPRLNNTYVAIRAPYRHISHTRFPYQHFPRTIGPFCISSVYPEVMNHNHTTPRRA